MKILGISAYYHDAAAALIDDTEILAAVQEERFTRKKHDPRFPENAIHNCLTQGDVSLGELDAIIFYDKPLLKFERLLETYLAHAPKGLGSFIRAMPIWLKEKLYLKTVLKNELARISGLKKNALPTLLFSEHHLSHAASAFFPSPYEEALVLCLDGVGEWTTSSAWIGKGNRINPLWELHFPHSLGLLYSAFTYYCGFRVNSGEYKLMGLAPYGEPRYAGLIREHLIDIKEDGSFALDLRYFAYSTGSTMTTRRFHRLFDGEPRAPDSDPTQRDMDLAASIQLVTEEVILKIANTLARRHPQRNLCLAGGVALNCVANGRILRETPFSSLWVQPAAGDAGGALGAALLARHHRGEIPRKVSAADDMKNAQLGPEYSDTVIGKFLDSRNIPYQKIHEACITDHAAELLADGKVVGWFQGRAEFGPRALGNRSILGDPRNLDMQKIMNVKIKGRESFRPFAPAVLEKDVTEYFDLEGSSPYMLIVAPVSEQQRKPVDLSVQGLEKLQQCRSTIPAITHVDFSARVQTVNPTAHPVFAQLIENFKSKTGCPVVINTSFNVRGEPPVLSPEDALRCFLATDMDVLVLGSYVLDKREQRLDDITEAKSVNFEAD